ncbi:MarR family transcriptional regulator [Amycolatopsis sp. cmx-11-12]|uniref:MarR family transcriptional regulator n=1 Tax=Amycolatopsis sp. cmx-11-12 TaxID=2785795 RepID=UPI003917D1E5
MSGDQACDAYAALIDQVGRLTNVVEAIGNGIARPTGQSLARWQVLAEIENEAAPVGAIAHRLGHTRQSVQRVADLLVDDELACTQLALRTTEGLDPERLDLARETLGELQRRLEAELP